MTAAQLGTAGACPDWLEQLLFGREVDGKYRLVRCIGRGGMGIVFEACDLSLARPVAIKLLTSQLPVGPNARWRFAREARAAARVNHPGVVRIYEVGADDELEYIAMELLEGEDLATRLARVGRLAPGVVYELALALSDALAAIHDAGVVHRDLKPRNIFLAREGARADVLKILDFGIAKLTGAEHCTESGELLGSLRYMAPEQLRGARHADAASDLWAVGAVLYEALAGCPPYGAGTLEELLRACTAEVPELRALCPAAPAPLTAAVMATLRRDPRERPASARALRALLIGTPGVAPRSTHARLPVTLLCGAALFLPGPGSDDPRSSATGPRAERSRGAPAAPASHERLSCGGLSHLGREGYDVSTAQCVNAAAR